MVSNCKFVQEALMIVSLPNAQCRMPLFLNIVGVMISIRTCLAKAKAEQLNRIIVYRKLAVDYAAAITTYKVHIVVVVFLIIVVVIIIIIVVFVVIIIAIVREVFDSRSMNC